ncbi:MAG: tetratricopeptide repeat protein [Chloracidobacterium sp.]|nr:tetratricopeptide repeat protein [Chloracidobacterium sp.]
MKKIFVSLLFLPILFSITQAQYFSSTTAANAGAKFRAGDSDGAIAILTKAIEKGKDLYEAHLMRGNIRSMKGDLDGAIADYSVALEIDPAAGEVYQKRAMYRKFKRDYAGAVKDLDSAIANSKYPARIFVDRGRVKEDLGDANGALADFQAALSYEPRLASAVIGISQLRERAGERDSAILVLSDFLAAFEGRHAGKEPVANVDIVGGGAAVKRESGESKDKQEFLISTGVVRSRPSTREESDRETAQMEQMLNVSHAYMTIGRIYIDNGDDVKALEYIEKGLKMNPQDPYGYSLRSRIRWKLADLRGVIDDMTKVVASPMRSPGYHLDRAILLTLQGKDAEAAAEFALHQKIFPALTDEKIQTQIERAKELRTGAPSKP